MVDKITKDAITNCNINIFGNWINDDIEINTNPIKYCIIENFIKEEVYDKILTEIPEKPTDQFYKYNNPIEVKYALDKMEFIGDEIKNLFFALSHNKLVNKFKNMFNLDNLEYDPCMHGAGIHFHPRHGRLNIHLDYEKHPITNKQRRLNIIYYVNEEWNIGWNGDTQLWDKNMEKCVVKSYPKKNTAIVFETIEMSWHGVPDKINCPENIYRKTLAYYYVSPLRNNANTNKLGSNNDGYRSKAVFVKRPQDPYDERMDKLYKIRPHRRITEEDMRKIWPEWDIFY